ncbi:hypothetical protein GCM10017687_18710 [Streptomyces echinatus]|uniref:Uncharacterized protein n=1 Tax=Streptomyces echinatus TaxID=67293 RepID=A0A7W9UU70_9ACTN|nr:hypothetical protein [Streptomyces echinatus]
MTAVETADMRAPAWRGGPGWLRGAAMLSGSGDGLPIGRPGRVPFVLSGTALIPVHKPDVPVVVREDGVSTAPPAP